MGLPVSANSEVQTGTGVELFKKKKAIKYG